MVSDATKQTQTTIAHHLEAVMSGDLDVIMSDYTEESILFTPEGPVRGLQQLRSFMKAFISNMPPGMAEAWEMVRQDAEGEVEYILWKAGSLVPLGTDTFIVRDGKIITQTFATYMPPSA